ncbi:hypothetical protein IQ268_26935 [Oculatella sp. LEGE 06141]|uniref:hypothetical protein n=1 Tax=Oculatella sp. LEGE 06141 TaxID=1828648 RepID=UPI0018820CBE|nr:hypothetical protein [Oculatella sp. LEGE 06141]MBE9182206.1 hypothetical protein [Oculatella sp. LEGE 06141]
MSSLYPAPHEQPKSTLRQHVKRRAIEFQDYVRALTKHSVPTQKFIIYGQGRTGSELLCSLLDAHPLIRCDTEILFHPVLFPKLLIAGRAAACQTSVYGFKVKIYQLQDVQKCDPRLFLSEMVEQGWAIVHIRRDNILRQGISLLTARQRKKFHSKSKKQPLDAKKVTIDCNLLLQQMRDREAYQQADAQVLQGIPHLTVVYENDLLQEQDHQSTVDRICQYLDIPSVAVETAFARLTPDQLSDLVENYDELVRVVGQSQYAHFLQDEGNSSVSIPI